jgi:hypothetical protein
MAREYMAKSMLFSKSRACHGTSIFAVDEDKDEDESNKLERNSNYNLGAGDFNSSVCLHALMFERDPSFGFLGALSNNIKTTRSESFQSKSLKQEHSKNKPLITSLRQTGGITLRPNPFRKDPFSRPGILLFQLPNQSFQLPQPQL